MGFYYGARIDNHCPSKDYNLILFFSQCAPNGKSTVTDFLLTITYSGTCFEKDSHFNELLGHLLFSYKDGVRHSKASLKE